MTNDLSDREELLQLILRDGILRRSETQPVLSRDGSSAAWMLDTLSVSMQARGAELAGRCLLDLLRTFDGRQIATYGLTGVPLMQAAVLQSGGRYHGLIVRKERKKHGSLKRIEGRIDFQEPTILLDDSVSSGLSMREGAEFLEEAGLRVEGGVALVRFGWDGGVARMRERGYHMEAVFDVFEDLMERMEDEPKVNRNPTRWVRDFPWGEDRAPEGLHPAHLARLGMDAYLAGGKLPRPPLKMDAEYDSSGGVWVSLRDRDQVYHRYARDGFWTFPGEAAPHAAEDVLRAALQTAKCLGDDVAAARRILERSHIAVTFFSALEKCHPGQLDNDRYGIVVCSRERPDKMGGALPRMPGIGNEQDQFRHARHSNAGLYSFEPYDVYRHEVRKAVERGVQWQPTGVPLHGGGHWHSEPAAGTAAARARDILRVLLHGGVEALAPLPAGLFPDELHSLYVSVYLDGKLRGCAGSEIDEPDRGIRTLVEAALRDNRFAPAAEERPSRLAVTVSLLFNPLELGEMSAEEAAERVRLGKQALAVRQGSRYGMLLPFVAVTDSLDGLGYALEVIDKAGITRAPYHWTRFDCATWLADERGVELLEYGFRSSAEARSFRETVRELAEWQCDYVARNLREEGGFYSLFEPFQNRLYRGHDAARGTHAAWILAKAARVLKRQTARDGAGTALDYYLAKLRETAEGLWLEDEDDPPSVAELSFLLLAITELDAGDSRRVTGPRLAAALWSRIDMHGRIATHRDSGAAADEFQDYFPGQVLFALAAAVLAGFTPKDEARIRRAFLYYRHRFRYERSFGQVSWLMQAGRSWWEVDGDAGWAGLVFEIADWIREFQLDKNGGFITGHQQDGPGYTTAVYLEGVAAAAALADRMGDRRRYVDCMDACESGVRFLRELTIRPEHDAMLSSPGFALGGVRRSLAASEVRLDFVQHSLAAVLDLHSGVEPCEGKGRSMRMDLDEFTHEPALEAGG
jgi:orotate phosphoribosyltransferase/AMMECR1 domain-containing protein